VGWHGLTDAVAALAGSAANHKTITLSPSSV